MHTISVIIPSYQQAQYLPMTLDSVLSQEGDFAIECLVMDGGSQDGSAEILERYTQRVRRREYHGAAGGVTLDSVSRPDRGQTHAINTWLERATGDILAYINSDDTYAPGAFARVVETFARHPDTIWCHGLARIVDDRGREIRSFVSAYRRFWARRYSYPLLLTLNPIAQPATFWSRRAYESVWPLAEEESPCMGYEHWLRLGMIADPVFLDAHLADFRVHTDAKSETRYREQFYREYELATRYADGAYPARMILHRLHSWMVVGAYHIIKRIF